MDYVYSASSLVVLWGSLPGGRVDLNSGDVWFASDPFVLARPELFSATPLVVRSTTGRDGPGATPVELEIAAVTVGAQWEGDPDSAIEQLVPIPRVVATPRGRVRRG